MPPSLVEYDRHRRALTARAIQADEMPAVRHLALVVGDDSPVRRTVLGALGGAIFRVRDLLGAAVVIMLLSPLLLLVAIAIKLDSQGPVLFAHRRLGRSGRHFDCLKFRTMESDAEQRILHDPSLRQEYVTNNFKIASHRDPRITRLGAFLRRSSIDELPQLWNVLTGDMALVGPRPIVALEGNHYGDDLDTLLSVRPGITGRWAVEGRSRLGYPVRADVELEYVRNRSSLADLVILLKTPWVVVTQRGAV